MKLHVVYRSSGGENLKARPSYYSKTLALASLLRAVEAVERRPEVVYLNDGPMPEDRLGIMQGSGEVVTISAGSNRGSLVRAFALPSRRRWDPDDLVWFAEDDYLYSRNALVAVLDAAAHLGGAQYFGLYGTVRLDPEPGRPTMTAPRDLPTPRPAVVDQERAPSAWYRAQATTSTFGGRVRAVLEDERILRLCTYTGGSFDTTTALVAQGLRPFAWGSLAENAVGRRVPRGAAKHRAVALVPLKVAANLRSHRRTSRRRVLVCTQPNLATHMEEPYVAPGIDWVQVARETSAWAASRGLGVRDADSPPEAAV